MLQTEVVTDAARFAALGEEWQRLWHISQARIFQRHDWISAWLEAVRIRPEIKLQIVVAWTGNRLVGALPCAVHRRSGIRMLHWAAQLFSDYCDCLLDPSQPADGVLTALWQRMWRTGGFDVASLQQVRPDAVSRSFLDGLVTSREPLHTDTRTERCMRIENRWKDGETFFRSLNKKGRNNHTRGKRILAELSGDVSFCVVEPGEAVGPVLSDIIRLKELWLRTYDPTSPLLSADGAILRAMLHAACESGLARIFLLKAGDKLAAASVNFVYWGRMEAYFTAYDATFERASPGTILIVEYAKWSFDRGLTMVDFLRGEEAFKFRLANAETVLSSYAGARTLRGQLALSGRRWLARRRQQNHSDDHADGQDAEALEAVG